ncbi:MAG: hypothetical protein HOM84_06020 [Thiotrichales bacterium]|jgi:hypothetical protein|nr:hypothetical protein [Thiotrichales bacterium]
MSEKESTITIEDKEYKFGDLTEQQQSLVSIYRTWSKELNDLRLDVAKTESALRDLTREITASMEEEAEVED